MFRFVLKKMILGSLINRNNNKQDNPNQGFSDSRLSDDLKQNLNIIRNILSNSSDVVYRDFSFGPDNTINAVLIFVDGMSDKTTINESILKPLMYNSSLFDAKQSYNTDNIERIQKTMVSVGDVKRVSTIDEIIDSCLYGDTILLVDGSSEALIITSKGWKTRGITEPKTEVVVRGPREAFNESLRSNTTLLRRKIRNPNLKMDMMKLGERSKTDLCVVYLKEVVNPKLVEEVKRRLKQIKIDAILESGYIENFIEDAPFSPFSTVANSEKPDVIAAKLLEGRVAIFVDGTPIVLTVPMIFVESFQSAEDYYSRPYYASIVRSLRFISFLISILAPAIYVALTTFHQEMLPTQLLVTIAASKEGTPFPAVVEILIMGVIFEILREAGIRLPRPVGSAISIVGALVIGQSAVEAGLIGAPVVIVVALTAISSFVIPAQADVTAILRVMLAVVAGMLGAYGILLVLLGWLIHLCSLRSFGVPYLSPISPLKIKDMKDVFVRVPIWAMLTRPKSIGSHDPARQEFRLWPEHDPENPEK